MELGLVDRAVRVGVPLLEEINDARAELCERLTQPHYDLAALKPLALLIVVTLLLLRLRLREELCEGRVDFWAVLDGHLAQLARVAALDHRRRRIYLLLPGLCRLTERLLQLSQSDLAGAILIKRVEEDVGRAAVDAQPKERQRALELDLGHLAVAILVPLSEQIDDARRVDGERLAQTVLQQDLRVHLWGLALAAALSGRLAFAAFALLAAAGLGRTRRSNRGARGLAALLPSLLPLIERAVELLELDEAALVLVPRLEDGVNVRPRVLEAELRHRAAELRLRDLSVAILIPLGEEVHDLDRVRAQRGLQLRRHVGLVRLVLHAARDELVCRAHGGSSTAASARSATMRPDAASETATNEHLSLVKFLVKPARVSPHLAQVTDRYPRTLPTAPTH